MTASQPRTDRRMRVGMVVVLSFVSFVSLFPILAVFLSSLRSDADIAKNPIGLPVPPTIDNYVSAWADASIGAYFLNSVIVTIGALALSTVVALPAAYAVGRWSFTGRGLISAVFLLGLMVPLKIGILPLNQMLDAFGLIDSLLGLVLVYAVSCIPMSILVLSTFYRQLPESLEEAATIDGAGPGRVFLTIMTPLIRPALAAVLVLNVGPVWNDFFMPLILLRSDSMFTIPVGITSFFGEYTAQRGLLYAGIVIAIVPVVVFFALAMKQIVGGLTAGIEK